MLLYKTEISDRKKELNNVNNYLTVIFATLLLLFSLYMFSDLPDRLNLPTIQNILLEKEIYVEQAFGGIPGARPPIGKFGFNTLSEFRKVIGFFIVTFIMCFLITYFLPVRLKRVNNIFWYLLFSIFIFDIWQVLLLIFIHLIIYSSFHLKKINKFSHIKLVRLSVINIPVFLVFLKIIGIEHSFFNFWFVLIFATQWHRLVLYFCDFRDGYVPMKVSLINYLSIFFNLPSVIIKDASIGQSYAYIESNFLCYDKNIIVKKGIKLIGLALFYVVFFKNILVFISQALIRYFDIHIIFPFSELANQYSDGNIKSFFQIFFSVQIFFLAIIFVRAYISHFKVGLWNLLGYNIHPHIDSPLLSTNFISFFSRYFYHYRAFLFRVFYYPIYEKLSEFNKFYRVLIATIFTLGGMHFFLHIYLNIATQPSISVSKTINQWPYYLILTILICITQVFFLIRKKRIRPWVSRKTFLADVFCAYIVFSIFSLISLFAWQFDSDISLDVRLGLFLKAIGF